MSCRGVLAPYVDPPEDGLVMASGKASMVVDHRLAEDEEPVVVTCGPVAVGGYDAVSVAINDVNGRSWR